MEESQAQQTKGDEEASRIGPLPEGDLTADRLDEFLALPDRQKIRWALQTETRVRLRKMEHPHGLGKPKQA
jgi:hypothetical protein